LRIQNIFSRVTGNSISKIDGLLRANGSANLFFLNPNGIIFGAGARLDIGGSFLASTAGSIKFTDGFSFSAAATPTTPLLSVSVPLGLQYGSNQSSVEVRGATLEVSSGQTLALVGGNVQLNGGALYNPLVPLGARVELGGLTGAGTIGLSNNGSYLSLNFPDGVTRGDVSIANGALIDVSAGGGGSITINARNLNITGRSTQLQAGIVSGLGSVGSQAGDIEINATQATNLDASFISNDVKGGGVGDGGNINITTGFLAVTSGARLSASARGQGKAGNVIINARDTVAFDGVASDGISGGAFSHVEERGIGGGGDINITTGSLTVTGGAQLNASTYGEGKAGSVIVNARDTVAFDGVGSARGSGVILSGALSNVARMSAGDGGGDINITTGSLTVTSGAGLTANTFGEGKAGSVIINARDTVAFDGVSRSIGIPSGAFSTARLASVGDGGDINITTGSLAVTGGARLSTSIEREGKAGNVIINARDTVAFDGVASNGISSGAYTSLEGGGKGDAGNINITTGSLFVMRGAVVSARTRGQGNGGNITVHANTLDAVNGGQLLTTSSSTGEAGDIHLNVTQSITLSGRRPRHLAQLTQLAQFRSGVVNNNVSPASGVFANTLSTSTNGGGDVTISTGQLTVRHGAQVSVKSEGTGNAGNLDITANSVLLHNRGQLIAETVSGEGGNINLQVEDLLLMGRNSLISAQAFNNGNGGNITIKPGLIVAIPTEDNDIVADAQQGNGGRINITTQGIFGLEFRRQRTPKSEITASSQLGISGTVNITRLTVDPSQGLAALPANLVDQTNQIDQRCLAGGAKRENTFTATGRGGLPQSPTEVISPDMVQDDLGTAVTSNPPNSESVSPTPTSPPKQLVEAQGWVVDDLGVVTLVASAPTVTPHSPALAPASCQESLGQGSQGDEGVGTPEEVVPVPSRQLSSYAHKGYVVKVEKEG
jgi:filamentous hemagglutinin family protein